MKTCIRFHNSIQKIKNVKIQSLVSSVYLFFFSFFHLLEHQLINPMKTRFQKNENTVMKS